MNATLAHRWLSGLVCLLGAAHAGCFPDSVDPGSYGTDAAVIEAASPAGTTTGDPGDTEAPPPGQTDASVASSDSGVGVTTTVGCNLSGRWIATAREVATALGSEEAAHTWLYFELSQTGNSGTVTRGLDCGENVVSISSVGANVDYPKTWPALMAHAQHTGRTFTSAPSGSGCAVSFEKRYFITGATVAFYDDPSQAMPMVADQGTSTTPGWEDWDQDGHPGYTMNVSGLATGQIYIAVRKWNMWSGSIATGSSAFKLADTWNSEQDLLGYNGSQLLTETASGVVDSDASLHFVDFARLSPTQATGSDADTCTAVRTLAPTLTAGAQN